MKKLTLFLTFVLLLSVFSGCSAETPAQLAATTLPVYEFTARLCQGTGITVTRLVTESVSCLHDYSLNVRQVKAAEEAKTIIISGAGLEEFLDDILLGADMIDASENIPLLEPCHHDHDHEEDSADPQDGHHHEEDPHIWLSPENAKVMAANICTGLKARYPQHETILDSNLNALQEELDALQRYGEASLSHISCREIITFHDGFAYFAESFHLTILEAVEEESGSEASARELIHLIEEVEHHGLPAIFTEKNGSSSAASIISRETGVDMYALDMAMSSDSYFDAMYYNIDTLKEALK